MSQKRRTKKWTACEQSAIVAKATDVNSKAHHSMFQSQITCAELVGRAMLATYSMKEERTFGAVYIQRLVKFALLITKPLLLTHLGSSPVVEAMLERNWCLQIVVQ